MRLVVTLTALLILSTAPLPLAFADEHEEEAEPSPLESFLQTLQPEGVMQTGNPYLNPGFEATTAAELRTPPIPGGPVGGLVAPPTIMFLDGTGEMNSSHSVAVGAGTSGNALVVHWNSTDYSKNVLLGQVYGNGSTPFVWQGATGVSFDLRSDINITDIHIGVHYGEDDIRAGAAVYDIDASDEYARFSVDVAVPENQTLNSVLFRFRSVEEGDIFLDNIKVEGSTFLNNSMTSDITDDYTIVFTPQGGDGDMVMPTLQVFETGIGKRFLVEMRARDYGGVTPTWVGNAGVGDTALAFLNASYLESGQNLSLFQRAHPTALSSTEDGKILFAVDETVAMASSEDGVAGIYGYMAVADPYTDESGRESWPTNGFYSEARNAVSDYGLADALDYAFTLVSLDNETVAGSVAEPTYVTVLDYGGSFDVKVSPPASGWAETLTLKVPGFADTDVSVDGTGADVLVPFTGTLAAGSVVEILPGIFTLGDTFDTTLPVPVINVCAGLEIGCETPTLSVQSFDDLTFDAVDSIDPVGGGLTFAWDFGDGSGANGQTVTHAFSAPGTYSVTLTATDADGKSESTAVTITVLNVFGTPVVDIPVTANRVEDIEVNVTGTDLDGVVTYVQIRVDGVWQTHKYVGATGFHVYTIETSGLALGTHLVEARVYDGFGWSALSPSSFEVVNLLPTASVAGDSTLVKQGSTVSFDLAADDLDSGGLNTSLDFGDGSAPVADANLSAPQTHTFGTAGDFTVAFTATDLEGGVTTASTVVSVDGLAPTTTPILPESETGWYNDNVSVTLDAVDDYGVASTVYAIDGGAVETYSAPFTVSEEGTTTIATKSEDIVGNIETAKSFSVNIDRTEPELDTSEMPADLTVVSGFIPVKASGTDALSGVDAMNVYLDGELIYSVAGGELDYAINVTEDLVNLYDVTVEAVDLAGNAVDFTVSVLVVNAPVDTSALPEVPAPEGAPTAEAGAAGSATNAGTNDGGLPTEGGDSVGASVDPNAGEANVTPPSGEGAASGVLAYAGFLTGGMEGSAGIWGFASIAGNTCSFATWGGDDLGMVDPSLAGSTTPKAECSLA